MRSTKQLIFQEFWQEFGGLQLKDFGGHLIKGNPREQRPISIKRPMHLVMRSSFAQGKRSFLMPQEARRIEALIHKTGREQGVKVYRIANSGNHLHLIVLPRSRKAFRAFIRALSGLIARLTLGVERGKALGLKFWDARPFTRILEWGRDYRNACQYLLQNALEAFGFIPYQPREARRKGVRRRWHLCGPRFAVC